jgi:DNA-binding transcriptional ArsR family regulator
MPAIVARRAEYPYLRGLFGIPLGALFLVSALGNWQWGPLQHDWVFVVAVLVVVGLLPVWDGADPGNVGLVLSGAAAVVNGVFDHLALVHEPGRLAILTVLSSLTDADFLFLHRTTGLTKGNLSSHLAKLEEAGLVTIEKRFVRKKPNTKVALTAAGRERISHYWDQLERLKRLVAPAAD